MTTARRTDLDGLQEPFKSGIVWLEHLLELQGVHMVRFETVRTAERQNMLFKRGNTKARAGKSAHQFGYAVDYVLDTDEIDTAQRLWKDKMVSYAWDTDTAEAKRTWLKFGRIVRRMGFIWGGDYGVSSGSGLIGWDFPHVEFPDWQARKGGQHVQ